MDTTAIVCRGSKATSTLGGGDALEVPPPPYLCDGFCGLSWHLPPDNPYQVFPLQRTHSVRAPLTSGDASSPGLDTSAANSCLPCGW